MRSGFDKITRPNMIGMLWPWTGAGAIIQPKPLTFWLLAWDHESLSSPDPFNTLRVHNPTIFRENNFSGQRPNAFEIRFKVFFV